MDISDLGRRQKYSKQAAYRDAALNYAPLSSDAFVTYQSFEDPMTGSPRTIPMLQPLDISAIQTADDIPEFVSWNLSQMPHDPDNVAFRNRFDKAVKTQSEYSVGLTQNANDFKRAAMIAQKYGINGDILDANNEWSESIKSKMDGNDLEFLESLAGDTERKKIYKDAIEVYDTYEASKRRGALELDRRYGTNFSNKYEKQSPQEAFNPIDHLNKLMANSTQQKEDGTIQINPKKLSEAKDFAEKMRKDKRSWSQGLMDIGDDLMDYKSEGKTTFGGTLLDWGGEILGGLTKTVGTVGGLFGAGMDWTADKVIDPIFGSPSQSYLENKSNHAQSSYYKQQIDNLTSTLRKSIQYKNYRGYQPSSEDAKLQSDISNITQAMSTTGIKRVIDGDTYEGSDGKRYRLKGIDTGESTGKDKEERLARQAKSANIGVDEARKLGLKAKEYADSVIKANDNKMIINPTGETTYGREVASMMTPKGERMDSLIAANGLNIANKFNPTTETILRTDEWIDVPNEELKRLKKKMAYNLAEEGLIESTPSLFSLGAVKLATKFGMAAKNATWVGLAGSVLGDIAEHAMYEGNYGGIRDRKDDIAMLNTLRSLYPKHEEVLKLAETENDPDKKAALMKLADKTKIFNNNNWWDNTVEIGSSIAGSLPGLLMSFKTAKIASYADDVNIGEHMLNRGYTLRNSIIGGWYDRTRASAIKLATNGKVVSGVPKEWNAFHKSMATMGRWLAKNEIGMQDMIAQQAGKSFFNKALSYGARFLRQGGREVVEAVPMWGMAALYRDPNMDPYDVYSEIRTGIFFNALGYTVGSMFQHLGSKIASKGRNIFKMGENKYIADAKDLISRGGDKTLLSNAEQIIGAKYRMLGDILANPMQGALNPWEERDKLTYLKEQGLLDILTGFALTMMHHSKGSYATQFEHNTREWEKKIYRDNKVKSIYETLDNHYKPEQPVQIAPAKTNVDDNNYAARLINNAVKLNNGQPLSQEQMSTVLKLAAEKGDNVSKVVQKAFNPIPDADIEMDNADIDLLDGIIGNELKPAPKPVSTEPIDIPEIAPELPKEGEVAGTEPKPLQKTKGGFTADIDAETKEIDNTLKEYAKTIPEEEFSENLIDNAVSDVLGKRIEQNPSEYGLSPEMLEQSKQLAKENDISLYNALHNMTMDLQNRDEAKKISDNLNNAWKELQKAHNDTLTPFDQKTSPDDVATTKVGSYQSPVSNDAGTETSNLKFVKGVNAIHDVVNENGVFYYKDTTRRGKDKKVRIKNKELKYLVADVTTDTRAWKEYMDNNIKDVVNRFHTLGKIDKDLTSEMIYEGIRAAKVDYHLPDTAVAMFLREQNGEIPKGTVRGMIRVALNPEMRRQVGGGEGLTDFMLSLHHEAIHYMDDVYKNTPSWQKMKNEILSVMDDMITANPDMDLRYTTYFNTYKDRLFSQLKIDDAAWANMPESQKIELEQEIIDQVNNEKLSDYLASAQLQSSQMGGINKMAEFANKLLGGKHANIRKLAMFSKHMAMLEKAIQGIGKGGNFVPSDNGQQYEYWDQRLIVNPLKALEIASINADTKGISNKIQALGFELEDTDDVVDKFKHGLWKDPNLFVQDLREANARTNNKIFENDEALNRFAMNAMLKFHPDNWEENRSVGLMITEDAAGNIKIASQQAGDGQQQLVNKVMMKLEKGTEDRMLAQHTVKRYRPKQAGWDETRNILKQIKLDLAQDNKMRKDGTGYSAEYLNTFNEFLNNIIDTESFNHPDLVTTMFRGKSFGGQDAGYDSENKRQIYGDRGYKVPDTDRYVLNSDGSYSPNSKGNYYVKTERKFPAELWGHKGDEIFAELIKSGLYPMVGSHSSSEMLNAAYLFSMFDYPSNEDPLYLETTKEKQLYAIKKLSQIEKGFLRYLIGSQLTFDEAGITNNDLYLMTEGSKKISVLSKTQIVFRDGEYKLEMLPFDGDPNNADQMNEFTAVSSMVDNLNNKLAPVFDGLTKYGVTLDQFDMQEHISESLETKKENIPSVLLSEILNSKKDNRLQELHAKLKSEGKTDVPLDTFIARMDEFTDTIIARKKIALIDSALMLSIDRSGKGFRLGDKYQNKYVSTLSHDWVAPDYSTIKPLLDALGYLDANGNLNKAKVPDGVFEKDGQLFTRAYIFDPEEWQKWIDKIPEGEQKAIAQGMLQLLGKASIDGATIMINNIANRPVEKSIQSFLGLLGGASNKGSFKNRWRSSDEYSSRELKHAMHPKTMDSNPTSYETSPPSYQMMTNLFSNLAHSGINLVVFRSALKGNGTVKLRPVKYGNNTVGIDNGGAIKGIYNEAKGIMETLDESFTPDMLVPVDMAITPPWEFAKKGISQVDWKNMALEIPLTGQNSLSWGDGQKGDPHTLASSSPLRYSVFSTHSPYMVPAGGEYGAKANELMTQAGATNAYSAVRNFVTNNALAIAGLHNGYAALFDHATNSMSISTKDIPDVINVLKAMKDQIEYDIAQAKEYGKIDEDGYAETSYGVGDYSSMKEYDLKLIDEVLGQREDGEYYLNMDKIPALLGMSNFILENSYQTRLVDPSFTKMGQSTFFWNMMNNKYKAFANNRGKGTMAVFVPDISTHDDVNRAIKSIEAEYSKEIEKVGLDKIDVENASPEQVEAIKQVRMKYDQLIMDIKASQDPMTGQWAGKSMGVSVSADIMRKHKIKVGDNVFGLLVPSDSGMSMIPLRVMGILDDNHRNAMTLNSEVALNYWGRDHDIDQISIMVNSPEWNMRGSKGQMVDGFSILWNTLASHGFHEGKPKDSIVEAKKVMYEDFKNAKKNNVKDGAVVKIPIDVEGGKEQYIEMPNFDNLVTHTEKAGKFGTPWSEMFSNVFLNNKVPVATPFSVDYPIQSRVYFGNKKIGVAANQADKISEWYNSSANRKIKVSFKMPASLADELRKSGLKTKAAYLNKIDFEVELNQDIYDSMLPYFKENTVDNYNLSPKQFMPHAWLSHAFIHNINIDGTKYNHYGDLKDDQAAQAILSSYLSYATNKFFAGKNVKDVYKLNNEGYEDATSKSRIDRALSIYGNTDKKENTLTSTIMRVLNDDFGLNVKLNQDKLDNLFELQSDYIENPENSIDRIMTSAFGALYQNRTELLKENFGAERNYSKLSAQTKLRMQLRASAALESMFYFDDKLPMNLLTNSPTSQKSFRDLTTYAKHIDAISGIAYNILTLMDADWANADKYKIMRRSAMQKYYTMFDELEINHRQYAESNPEPLVQSSLARAIFDTFMEAELNNPYRGSIIYHKNDSGDLIYAERPFDSVFLQRNADKTLRNDRELEIAKGKLLSYKIKLVKSPQGDYVPVISIGVRDVNSNRPVHLKGLLVKDLTAKLPKILEEVAPEISLRDRNHAESKVYEGLIFGGLGLATKGPDVEGLWGKNIVGQRPSGINEKKGLVRKLYANSIEAMAMELMNDPSWTSHLNTLPEYAKATEGSENPMVKKLQYTKDIVAGAVLALPLESASWQLKLKKVPLEGGYDRAGSYVEPLKEFALNKNVGAGMSSTDALKHLNTITGLQGKGGIQTPFELGNNAASQGKYMLDKHTNKSGEYGAIPNVGAFLGYINTFPKMIQMDMKAKHKSLAERIKTAERYKGLERMVLESFINEDASMVKNMINPSTLDVDYNKYLTEKTALNKKHPGGKFSKVEELPSNLSFLLTELGAAVYDDLKARGINPSLRYESKKHGNIHDVFDIAKDMMNTIHDITPSGEADMSNIDQYNLEDMGYNSLMFIHKQLSRMNPSLVLGGFTNALMRFGRKNTTINKKMMNRLDKFLNGMTYSDNTPITRENIFSPAGLDQDKSEIAQSKFRDFIFQEFADAAGLDSLGKEKLRKEWLTEAPNMTKEDYIERLAVKQLENISSVNATIINEALRKGRIDSKAFYNTYAENIAEMYHVIKNFSKQKKIFEKNKNNDMTVQEANNHVISALKLNTDLRYRSTPRMLSSLLSSQRVLMRDDVMMIPKMAVRNGQLVTDFEPILIQNQDASSGQFRGNSAMSLKKVSVTTGEIYYDMAQKLKEISDVHDRTLNDVTEHITNEYKSNTELEVMEVEKELSKVGYLVEQSFGNDFSVEYGEQNGVVFPKISFIDANGNKISAGITGEKAITWTEFKSQFKQNMTQRAKYLLDANMNFTKGDALSKAIDVYLGAKLLAAQQAVVAKHYNEIAVALTDMLYRMGDMNYAAKFQHALSQLTLMHDLGNLGDAGNVTDRQGIVGSVLEAAGLKDTRYQYMPSISMDSTQLIEKFSESVNNAREGLKRYVQGSGQEPMDSNTKAVMNMLMMMFNIGKTKLSGKNGMKYAMQVLDTADSWVKRQLSVEDTSLNVNKDMIHAINKIELNPKNKLFAEIIAMFGNPYQTRPISLHGMRRMNDMLGSIYQHTSYDILHRMYELSSQNMDRFHVAFNTGSVGHVDENPIIYNEINHMLRNLKGESFIFTKEENFDNKIDTGTPVRVTYLSGKKNNPLYGISEVDDRHSMVPSSTNIHSTIAGYVVDHGPNDMLIWNASSNNYTRVKRGDVVAVHSGMEADNITKKYLNYMTDLLGQDMASKSNQIRSLIDTRKKARNDRDFDAVNRVSEELGKLSLEWKRAMNNDNIGLKIAKLKNKVSGYEAMLNYQGVGTFLTGLAGLSGAVGASVVGVMGSPVLMAAAPLLGMFGATQLVRGVSKALRNATKNYTSSVREHMMMFGISKTFSDFFSSWKDSRSDSQAATVSKVTTFSKDDIEMKQTIGDIRFKELQDMEGYLKDTNASTKDRTDKLLKDLADGRITSDELYYLSDKIMKSVVEEKNSDGIDNSIVDYYKHMSFNKTTGEYAYDNGYSEAILEQMRKDLIKETVTTWTTFGRLVSRTEEPARRLAEKMLGNRLEKESMLEGASSSEVRNYVNDIMNVAIGEYGSASKLNWNRSGLPALMRLYERFNRYNSAYYINGIWKGVDKALSIDFLSQEFKNYGLDNDKIKDIKHIDVENYEIGNVTTGYTPNELNRFKRKLSWSMAVAATSKMAIAGLAYLISQVFNNDLAKKFYKFGNSASFVRDANDALEFGGVIQSSINAAIAVGTVSMIDMDDMIKRKIINKQQASSIISEQVQGFDKILSTGGLGFGYSAIMDIPFNLGLSVYMHNNRDHKFYGEQLDKEMSKFWGRQIATNARLSQLSNVALNTGDLGLEMIGSLMGAKEGYNSSKIAEDLMLSRIFKKRKKKLSKKQKKQEMKDKLFDLSNIFVVD